MARHIEILDWHQAAPLVRRVSPEFAGFLDDVAPITQGKLIKATYQFGDLIVEQGRTFLPSCKNPAQLVAIDSPELSSEINNELNYTPIPLMLMCNKTAEVFVDNGERTIPLTLGLQGALLGVFEVLYYLQNKHVIPPWSVSAGARNIFILPKVSEKARLKKLFHAYNLPFEIKIGGFKDHWTLLKAIAQSEAFEQTWDCEVIFFGRSWFDKLEKDNHVSEKFKRYLYAYGWDNVSHRLSDFDIKIRWEHIINAISDRHLFPRPYISDHIKHLISLALGKLPGFRPMDDSQSFAPTRGLEDAFVQIYQLKYCPTFMACTSPGSIDDGRPVYYSLSYPTLLEGTGINRRASTVMDDLREIKLLMEVIKQKSLLFEEGSVTEMVDFTFFHVEQDRYHEIESSKKAIVDDLAFKNDRLIKLTSCVLCDTSTFWRGCIRLAKWAGK